VKIALQIGSVSLLAANITVVSTAGYLLLVVLHGSSNAVVLDQMAADCDILPACAYMMTN